jgi:hypothetical protein
MSGPKFPKIQAVLMLIFLIGGSLLLTIPGLPVFAAGIDAAVWIVGYFGYIFIILASIIYTVTGK